MLEADVTDETALVIDTRGLSCPLPILKLKKVLRSATGIKRVRVLATDPLMRDDIEAFCEAERYRLEQSRQLEDMSFEFCIAPA